jgi:HK97 family phage major capsid protein|nr:MAG TPA: Major capsid protein [Caudoviricetes sp.]
MGYLKDELRGFVPVEKAKDIIKMVTRGSSILRMSKVEPMTSDKKTFNVLTDGPGAYWVSEGERIQTSGAQWIHPKIEAKKLAVIIPVTKEKLEDSTISVFEELKPEIAEAFYRAIDAACLFGTNSPFETNIMQKIEEQNMIVVDNSNIDLAVSDAMALVEENGYDPAGFIGRIGVKNSLRKLRDANGAPAYVNGTTGGELYAQPIEFVRNGAWDNTKADLITGEWKYSIVGIRSGLSYEILKEATLQGTLDSDGKPLSLAEQDMVAIKATMRLGYLVVKDDAFAAYKNGIPTLGTLTVTSAAGDAAGTTKITVVPNAIGEHRLVYKTAASTAPAVAYGQDLSAWTQIQNGGEITATNGHKITVAEVTAEGEARKAGNTEVVSKTE